MPKNEIAQEFLDGVSPGLKSKTALSVTEERLLGQMSVVAFRNDAPFISLSNFSRCQKIQLARLPRQYKQGDKQHNKWLHEARIKTGKAWIDLLPCTFKDELIAELFLDIEEERACATLAKFHNTHRRLSPKDSSSFKGFVRLNDSEYVRLSRGLFYWTGLRLLAPINEIYLLRDRKCTEDYTTLERVVVDMTKVTRTGNTEVFRKI